MPAEIIDEEIFSCNFVGKQYVSAIIAIFAERYDTRPGQEKAEVSIEFRRSGKVRKLVVIRSIGI